MKKTIAILLLLALLPALCGTAAAATYTAGDHYAVIYPDGLLLDDTSYTDENTEDSQWLFLLEGDDFLIDAYWTLLEGYQDFSLSNADELDKQTYLDEVMTTFADQSPALLDTVATDSGLVFYIFHLEDEDGPYLYAEVIENGVCASFVCYYYDGETDEALLETLETILRSVAAPDAAEE